MLKDQGVGQQGHSRSASENARALLHVAVHQQHGLSYDAAIKATAAAELASPNTLRDAALQFTTHGTLPSPTTAHRGRGNPEHPLHSPAEPSLEAELLIHRRLEEVKARNLYESSVTLRAALRFELRLDVSERTLLRWLHELGYVYGKKRFVGAVKPACRHVRMRRFILEYAAALQRQLTGDTMLVYTDESYVHDRHCAPMLWFNPSSPTQNEVQGDDSGGKRLMIVHAMTRDGLLETPGAVATNLLTERVPTAELIFETLGTDDDYHTAMDGDRYLLWLRNHLLPAFDARYPGQRMTLVLDNAGYHHIRGEDWFTPSQMSVTECVSFLNYHRVRSNDTPARHTRSSYIRPARQAFLSGAYAPRAAGGRARAPRRAPRHQPHRGGEADDGARSLARVHASLRTRGATRRAGVEGGERRRRQAVRSKPQRGGHP
jgi:transposase